ncbi:RNA-binding domain-containing protein [Candidatus Thiosymbion oneisti]|uniref:RNA-binding domain-containing protein n=1 Tax=Candidatus Thiosymbion oneisti TaxID=589554 RepID=UPI002109E86E|nr:RNA-binding domain-containing protein [Candidatus Thiosymbion oneisti]
MMTKSELLELIANGENSGVEFKRDDLRPEQLAKEVVALANFQGGHILLGVDDDGSITGIRRDELEHWVMDTVFGRTVHPMILPFYEEIRVDDRLRVAVITISQGTTKPYVVRHHDRDVVRHHDREDIYIRVGSISRRATREQQARLYAIGGMLHAEQLPVSGSSLGDLSRDRLTDYLATIVGDNQLPMDEEAWGERLCSLGFMVERADGPPVCTIAGLVLFGHAPRRLLPQSGIRWMAFDGADKTYRALDDRLIDGPLAALRIQAAGSGREIAGNGVIEGLVDAMRPFISEEAAAVDASMRRERRWLYPVAALREAIVNALAHRDWTRYEEIEVVSYKDRIEVLSPGALQNSMTIAKMIAGRRSPRNHLIVEVLRDYGYVDARGMGVRNKIIPLLKEQNGVGPEFQATEDYLKVVMFKGERAGNREDIGSG